MNLGQLIASCRSETRDLVKRYQWEDSEWIEFLNEAVDEACIRSRLIEDEAIELDAKADDPYVEIPEHLWSIRGALFDGRRLELIDKQMITDAAWEELSGTPVACYEVGGKLRLYRIPETDGVVKVHAFCTPEEPMSKSSDSPQGVKPRLHIKLTDWALYRAYSKNDADTFDANLAQVHLDKFERVFGPRHDEKEMRRLRINVVRRVKGVYF